MHAKELAYIGIFVVAPALSGLAGPAAAVQQDCPLLEPAREALAVEPDEDGRIAISTLLERFEEVSDWTVLMDAETRALAERAQLLVSGPIQAEPGAVVEVVEALLWKQQFVWSIAHRDAPRLLSLRSLQTQARQSARSDALVVPAKDLARWADHPGFLIETVLSLPNLDARTLSNSLRSTVVDPNLQQILPVGNTAELLLQGTGRNVFDLAAMLERVNAIGSSDAEASALAVTAPLVPRAEGKVTVGDEGQSLLDLVFDYASRTGQVAVLDEESVALLERAGPSVPRPVTVAGDGLTTLFEELLRDRRFAVTEVHRANPRIFTVQSLETVARQYARTDARFVPVADLDICARRPATLFMTALGLPSIDVRTLSNSMRAMVIDPNLLQMVPIGEAPAVLLQARGRELVRLVELLRTVDSAEGARPQPVEPAEAPEEDDDEDD